MADSRLDQAGKAAQAHPQAPVRSLVVTCPANCEQAWKDVEDETRRIAASSNPNERNRKISAAYAAMSLRRPDMEWIGLAAIVSRQAGCAMDHADQAMKSPIPLVSGPAGVAKDALGQTNRLIFTDIYPVMRFYEKHGADSLERCKDQRPGGQPVPPALIKAAKAIDAGDLKTASDLIANYEQKDIVQSRIYNQERFKEVFAQNEFWADTMLGRFFGAKPAEIAMSSRCNSGGTVPLKGSIGNANDRVSYYETLMRHFRDKGEAWRRQTMTDIVQQGQ